MKRSTTTSIWFGMTVLLLGISSCKKFEDVNVASTAWNPTLAIPIGHAKFGVYDVLAALDSNDLIVVNQTTGEVALVYSSTIASFDASQIVQFGNASESQTFQISDFSIPVSANFSANANTFRNTLLTVAMPGGEELDSTLFKSGTLNIHVESDFKHDISGTITFPGILNNGVPVSEPFSLTYTGSLPVIADIQIDLTQTYADFTNFGTSVNQTPVEIQASVMGTGNEISGTEAITVNSSIQNAQYSYAKGYFGQQSVGQQIDTVLLRIFQNASNGVFELRDPKIDFYIDNSFGFPIQIDLANLKTINIATGVETPLAGYPTQIDVNYPTQLNNVAQTNFELNNSNTSNLSSIIEPTPKYFSYEVDATSNPANDPSIDNFIEDDSRFELRAEVLMPLDGLAYGFTVSDTVDFDFNEDTDMIESVMFRVIADNGFPVRFYTSIKALDVNGATVFTLFPTKEALVEPALVDANGVVNERTTKISDINLTQDQIKMLGQVDKLEIFGEAETLDAQSGTMVKFFDYYNIEVKLAMQIKGGTKVN